jgi:hypothetical protein
VSNLPRLAALLLTAAILATLAAAPTKVEAGPLRTGITNLGTDELLGFQRTRAAGASFVRIRLDWQDIAPEDEPADWRPDDPADENYNWFSDTDVRHAVQVGLTPVLQIDEAPGWAQRCRPPSVLDYAICDPDPAALAAFATAAARRYSGRFGGLPRVQYWQVLNEPNLSLFFYPQFDSAGKAISPALYRTLINSAYDAIKAVDPTNIVVAAGLGPIAVPKWTIGPLSFARNLLCIRGHERPRPSSGGCSEIRFDIFAIQPYTTGGPTHVGGKNDVQLGAIGRLVALVRAADRAKRISGVFKRTPIWITEFSWDTQPPDPGGLPLEIATRWTSEALYQAWRAGVSHFFWFSLHDDDHEPNRPFPNSLESGLYFRGPTLEQDRPKPTLSAFRYPFVAYPKRKGLYFWGRTPDSAGGKVLIQVWKGDRWHRVAVAKARGAGIFEGLARTGYGRNKKGTARAFYNGHGSVPFSMRPVRDFRQPPFG